jgi:hypothetical protein
MKLQFLAAIVLVAAGAAAAQSTLNLPRSRAGYWEVRHSGPNGVVHVSHSCSRGETPDLKGEYARFCHTAFRRTPTGGIVGDGACASRGITGTWHITATGDFVTHYATDSVSTMVLPARPPITTRGHTEGRWIGPCPAGMAR